MEIGYFNPGIAKEFGVIEAVFLQMLFHAIQDNREMCIVEHNTVWFPCAINEWENYIDIWSARQINRIVNNCLHNHTLALEHYDTDERRRRGWYAINPAIVPRLEETEQNIWCKQQ